MSNIFLYTYKYDITIEMALVTIMYGCRKYGYSTHNIVV